MKIDEFKSNEVSDLIMRQHSTISVTLHRHFQHSVWLSHCIIIEFVLIFVVLTPSIISAQAFCFGV